MLSDFDQYSYVSVGTDDAGGIDADASPPAHDAGSDVDSGAVVEPDSGLPSVTRPDASVRDAGPPDAGMRDTGPTVDASTALGDATVADISSCDGMQIDGMCVQFGLKPSWKVAAGQPAQCPTPLYVHGQNVTGLRGCRTTQNQCVYVGSWGAAVKPVDGYNVDPTIRVTVGGGTFLTVLFRGLVCEYE